MKKQGTSTGWAYILLCMMLIGFTLTLVGCKSQESITDSVRTETLIKELHDTLWLDRLVYIVDSTAQATTKEVRDCTVVRQDANGQAISTERWHFQDTNKEMSKTKQTIDSVAYYRSVIDSLRRLKNDSVYVKKEVEKELSVWDKAKLQFGGWALFFVLATIIYTIWCCDRKDKLNV